MAEVEQTEGERVFMVNIKWTSRSSEHAGSGICPSILAAADASDVCHKALTGALNELCHYDREEGREIQTYALSITGCLEISAEEAESMIAALQKARPRAEIDAELEEKN